MDPIANKHFYNYQDFCLKIGSFEYDSGDSEEIPSYYLNLFIPEEATFFRRPACNYFEDMPKFYSGLDFKAKKETIIRRLDIMGYTKDVCSERLNMWVKKNKTDYNYFTRMIRRIGNLDKEKIEIAEKQFRPLIKINEKIWREYARYIQNHFSEDSGWSNMRHQPYYDDEILNMFLSIHSNRGMSSPMYFDGMGTLTSFRIFLEESCFEEVSLTIWNKDCQKEDNTKAKSMIELSKKNIGTIHSSPALIIPEGKSDYDIIRPAFEKMFPDVSSYFKVFDHRKSKSEGGTSTCEYYMRALEEAGVSAPVIILYDNDEAGNKSFDRSKKQNNDENIILTKIQNLEWLEEFPVNFGSTIECRDLNGCSATIETIIGKNIILSNKQFAVVAKEQDIFKNKFQAQIKTEKKLIQKDYKDNIKNLSKDEMRAVYEDLYHLIEKIINEISKERGVKILSSPVITTIPKHFRYYKEENKRFILIGI